ncbi:hypothetical protein PSEEN2780 [Pseudomonas entomophila L48]|uniref:Uncharacterized protein n=1 Tax=Pseudomonas entomophila (strain L48) TaxID=384676 RepID=Q1I9W2_PSEE4|nr:hypothetical protein PSEEN2780 [Pseudomonas entomophila L48]
MGVCGDLTGGMWDWTTQEVTSHNIQFNIIYIMRTLLLTGHTLTRPVRELRTLLFRA